MYVTGYDGKVTVRVGESIWCGWYFGVVDGAAW